MASDSVAAHTRRLRSSRTGATAAYFPTRVASSLRLRYTRTVDQRTAYSGNFILTSVLRMGLTRGHQETRRRTLVHCNRGIESACRAGHPTWLRCSSLKYWRYDLGRRAVLARRLAILSASPYVRRPVLRRPGGRRSIQRNCGRGSAIRLSRSLQNCKGARSSPRFVDQYWQRLTSAGAPGASTPSSGSCRGLCGNWIRPVRGHDQS